MKPIRKRILEFIEHEGTNKRQFYLKTGLSNGFLDKDRSVGNEKIEDICRSFPNINPEWLLTGKGSMLRSEAKQDIATESHGRNNIAIIDQKAIAGWLDFLDSDKKEDDRNLPSFTLPELMYDTRKYKCIQVAGNSMEPTICNMDYLIAYELESVSEIQNGQVHIIVSREGVVAKRLYYQENDKFVKCVSDNSYEYGKYNIDVSEIRKILRVKMKLSTDLSSWVAKELYDNQKELTDVYRKLSKVTK